jgi:hypothetical protein
MLYPRTFQVGCRTFTQHDTYLWHTARSPRRSKLNSTVHNSTVHQSKNLKQQLWRCATDQPLLTIQICNLLQPISQNFVCSHWWLVM